MGVEPTGPNGLVMFLSIIHKEIQLKEQLSHKSSSQESCLFPGKIHVPGFATQTSGSGSSWEIFHANGKILNDLTPTSLLGDRAWQAALLQVRRAAVLLDNSFSICRSETERAIAVKSRPLSASSMCPISYNTSLI